MPTKRYFEYKDEKSDKFWEIELRGSSYLLRYGKRDTPGQIKKKNFADPEIAKADAAKKIDEKINKGYVEKTQKKKGPARVKGKKTSGNIKLESKSSPGSADSPLHNYLTRFKTMVSELEKNPSIELIAFKINPPAKKKDFERANGYFPLTDDMRVFYAQCNGLELEWEIKNSLEHTPGLIKILPLGEVFSDWIDIIYFDEEDLDFEYRPLHPLDFFVSEACAALYLDFETGAAPEVYYHYCGEEMSSMKVDFAGYLELLLESRGFWYWQKSVRSLKDAEKGFKKSCSSGEYVITDPSLEGMLKKLEGSDNHDLAYKILEKIRNDDYDILPAADRILKALYKDDDHNLWDTYKMIGKASAARSDWINPATHFNLFRERNETLQDNWVLPRVTAVAACILAYPGEVALAEAQKALKDKNPVLKIMACQTLRCLEIRTPEIIASLRKLVKPVKKIQVDDAHHSLRDNQIVSAYAALALARLDPTLTGELEDNLCQALFLDWFPDGPDAALYSLAEYGELKPETIAYMFKLCGRNTPAPRIWANLQIAKLKSGVAQAAATVLDNKVSEFGYSIEYALGQAALGLARTADKKNLKKSVPSVRELLESEEINSYGSDETRVWLVEALARIDPESDELIKTLALTETENGSSWGRGQILAALGYHRKASRHLDFLEKTLGNKQGDYDLRFGAARALGRMGETGLQVLSRCLDSPAQADFTLEGFLDPTWRRARKTLKTRALESILEAAKKWKRPNAQLRLKTAVARALLGDKDDALPELESLILRDDFDTYLDAPILEALAPEIHEVIPMLLRKLESSPEDASLRWEVFQTLIYFGENLKKYAAQVRPVVKQERFEESGEQIMLLVGER